MECCVEECKKEGVKYLRYTVNADNEKGYLVIKSPVCDDHFESAVSDEA